MSSIVYQHDKRSGSTYAYRSTSFRDPQTGRPRCRREYLGRLDPATGEIVPKAGPGRRNRSRLGGEEAAAQARAARDSEALAEVERLNRVVRVLRERNETLESAVDSMHAAVAAAAEALGVAAEALGEAARIGGVSDGEEEEG